VLVNAEKGYFLTGGCEPVKEGRRTEAVGSVTKKLTSLGQCIQDEDVGGDETVARGLREVVGRYVHRRRSGRRNQEHGRSKQDLHTVRQQQYLRK
jgi:hypothetical protein